MAGLTTIFAALAEDVWFKESFAWDAPIALAIHQLSHPWLDSVMEMITQTGNIGAVGLVSGLTIWLYWRHQQQCAILLITIFGGVMGLNTLLKLIFARPRPHLFAPLVLETDYSFPSGHTVAATVLYGLLAVFLWRQRHYGWALLASSWVFAVAVSRVYLGVHYPSDVLAALAIGGIWLLGVFFIFAWYTGWTGSIWSATKDKNFVRSFRRSCSATRQIT